MRAAHFNLFSCCGCNSSSTTSRKQAGKRKRHTRRSTAESRSRVFVLIKKGHKNSEESSEGGGQ
jgi:hypothetical protein